MKTSVQLADKENRQLTKLKKSQVRGNSSKYFLVLLVLIAVVNILDEVTSNLTVTVQSSFITEFFVTNPYGEKFSSLVGSGIDKLI